MEDGVDRRLAGRYTEQLRAGQGLNPTPAGQAGAPAAIQPATLAGGEKLRVVATTAILGDVVRNVGGDALDLTVLIGPGQDPHAYEPAPQDVAAIEKAQVVFENGLGLEAGLELDHPGGRVAWATRGRDLDGRQDRRRRHGCTHARRTRDSRQPTCLDEPSQSEHLAPQP